MPRKSLVTVSGSLLSLTGLVILTMAGSRLLTSLFGGPPLSVPSFGDAGWMGVAFTRVCGAALGTLGLVMMATTRLPPEAAKTIGGPLFVGLALLTIVAVIQAQAIWSTSGGWVFAAVLLVGCIGAGQLMKPRPGRPEA